MSIRMTHIKDHYISIDQSKYAISVVEKYFDPATVKSSTNFYMTTFTYGMISTKADSSTSDDRVDKFSREVQIH